MIKVTSELSLNTLEVVELFNVAQFPDETYKFSNKQTEGIVHNADIIVTGRDEKYQLQGVALTLTNYVNACYLTGVAVHPDFQRQGLATRLIEKAIELSGGDDVTFVALSTPDAVAFYENAGFERCKNGFMRLRRR